MTPRWGLKRPEGRRLATKMPPLRGFIHFKRHRPAFQEAHKFAAHPAAPPMPLNLASARLMKILCLVFCRLPR